MEETICNVCASVAFFFCCCTTDASSSRSWCSNSTSSTSSTTSSSSLRHLLHSGRSTGSSSSRISVTSSKSDDTSKSTQLSNTAGPAMHAARPDKISTAASQQQIAWQGPAAQQPAPTNNTTSGSCTHAGLQQQTVDDHTASFDQQLGSTSMHAAASLHYRPPSVHARQQDSSVHQHASSLNTISSDLGVATTMASQTIHRDLHQQARADLTPTDPQRQEPQQQLTTTATTPGIAAPLTHTIPIPNKGLGTVATASIPAGTRILTERPLLTITRAQYHATDLLRPTVIRAFLALANAEQRAAYLSLSSCPSALAKWEADVAAEAAAAVRFGDDDPDDDGEAAMGMKREEQVDIMARWETNAFGVREGQGGRFAAVICVRAARMNHSCVPNAAFAWNERLGALTVHAVRDVAPGEEVTVGYVDLYREGAERRKLLKEKYGFECDCGVCVGGGQDGSDQRRRELNEVARWSAEEKTGEVGETREVVERGVVLHKEEGLVGLPLALFCKDSIVDRDQESLEKAIRALQICLGDDNPEVEELRERLARIAART